MNKLSFTLLILFFIPGLLFSQTHSKIEEMSNSFIENKSPFYLTGKTSYTSSKNDDKYNFVLSLDGYNEIEYTEFKDESALYPIAVKLKEPEENTNEYVVIAVTNPKLGVDYYDVSNYDKHDIYYLHFPNALLYEEIDVLPLKIKNIDYHLPFFKYLLGKQNATSEINIDCFSDFLLKDHISDYSWRDEFHERETLSSWAKIIKSEFLMTQDLDLESVHLYTDYEVIFDEFNFDNSTYTVRVKTLYRWSNIFYSSLFGITTNWGHYKHYNKELTLSFTTIEAKEIINILNGERKAYMRVELKPNNSKMHCDCSFNCNLSFLAQELKFSSNKAFQNSIDIQ